MSSKLLLVSISLAALVVLVASQNSVTLTGPCVKTEFNDYQGNIGMGESQLGFNCTWNIQVPPIYANLVPHQLQLQIQTLNIRPKIDSLIIYQDATEAIVLASLIQIDASQAPLTIYNLNSSSLYVTLFVSSQPSDPNHPQFSFTFTASYNYKCTDTPARCQIDNTGAEEIGFASHGAKAGFIIVVLLVMFALVVFGFAKSYRTPFD